MATGDGHVPDWRDASAYAPLLIAERSAFAWEWIRRNDDYRAAAAEAAGHADPGSRARLGQDRRALHWGLHAFEDPGVGTPEARPMWTAERHSLVLRATAVSTEKIGDSFYLANLGAMATLIKGEVAQHLLVSDGLRNLRIDAVGTSLLSGPVLLHYDLHGIESAERPLLVLRQLIAFVRRNSFSPVLHRMDRRARRYIVLLRTYDALRNGASQRAIAAELLNRRAEDQRWRVQAPSLRSQAQRLVRNARLFTAGGFWSLLR